MTTTVKTVWMHAGSAATLVAGYVVALVPAWGKEQKVLIMIGTIVFAAVILLADAIRNRPAGESIVTAGEDEIKQILATYDFGPTVQKEIVKMLNSSHPAAPVTTTK